MSHSIGNLTAGSSCRSALKLFDSTQPCSDKNGRNLSGTPSKKKPTIKVHSMCFLALLDGKLKFNLCSLWLKFLCNLVACYVLFSNAKHYSLASPGLDSIPAVRATGFLCFSPPSISSSSTSTILGLLARSVSRFVLPFSFAYSSRSKKHANTVR